MDKTRSRVILYALTGIGTLIVAALFPDNARINSLLQPSLALALALLAIALLARTCLMQLDAAHSLSVQLGKMTECRDIRHLFVPTSGTPEMNAIGLQLNVLIYTLAESAAEVSTATVRQEQTLGTQAPRPDGRIDLETVADAA